MLMSFEEGDHHIILETDLSESSTDEDPSNKRQLLSNLLEKVHEFLA